MRNELLAEFRVPKDRVTVIPFGINNTTPTTGMSTAQAKQRLGLSPGPVALFFGQIAPYKGLEYLVAALPELMQRISSFRLIVAGKVKKGTEAYWQNVERQLNAVGFQDRVTTRIEHIPDDEVELFFKAADVLIVPYTHIFQSGVPFLAYSFGLPVIATDVGSLTDDVIEGKTGFVCRPLDSADLAHAIRRYFSSDLYRHLQTRRAEIMRYANERYSWMTVGSITESVYRSLADS
jgi:glycosyltransferase involved in cell wall biosynthesis